jgi:guanylate kinase
MKKRTETQKTIRDRIKLAKKELQFSRYYDYLVINKSIDTAIEDLNNILSSEVRSK